MPEPLALLVYERLLPGGQLVNQLQDRGYRVHTLSDPSKLTATAETEKPMVVVVDVSAQTDKIFSEISRLKSSGSTSHIPVIAVAPANNGELQERARTAGAKLVVSDNAIVAHLDQFLEQALQVD
jgi:PleD family two-component response regulator